MTNYMKDILKYTPYFRVGFLILLIGSVVINYFILPYDSNFYIMYIIAAIFLGIGFYNQPNRILIMLTLLVVLLRFFSVRERKVDMIIFIIYLFTYLLITFISVGLMRNIQTMIKDNLDLISVLSKALDSRDPYTRNHSENVAKFSVMIAEEMKLSQEVCKEIYIGGLLHDIGKIGTPEAILTKPGRLTFEEYNVIKEHPQIGYDILKQNRSFQKSGILDIVLYHHERYDGKGYPEGLQGNDIPFLARIVSVADSFDAMTSNRTYRAKHNIETALNEISENRGTQFDPDIVDAFLIAFDKNKN